MVGHRCGEWRHRYDTFVSDEHGFPTPEIRDFFQSEAWVGAFDRIEAYLVRR
jgi:hypothetical protein